MPIIKMYEKEREVHKIIADKSIEEVFKEVESILESVQYLFLLCHTLLYFDQYISVLNYQ